jgi:hypothetical protein
MQDRAGGEIFITFWGEWTHASSQPKIALADTSLPMLISDLRFSYSSTYQVMFGERDKVIREFGLTKEQKARIIKALNSRLTEEVRVRCIQSVMRYQRDQIYTELTIRGDEALVTFESGVLEGNEYSLIFFKVMTGDLRLKKTTIPNDFVERLARGLARRVMDEVKRVYTFDEKLKSSNSSIIAGRMRPLFSSEYNELKRCVDDYDGNFQEHFIRVFLTKTTVWRKFCEELMKDSMRLDGDFPADERDSVLQPAIDAYYDALITEAEGYLRVGYRTVTGSELNVVVAQTRGLFQTLKHTAEQRRVEMETVKNTLQRYFSDISEFWSSFFGAVWKIHNV